MLRYTPGAIAAAFRSMSVGPATDGDVRLHWLVYLADGWNLAIHGVGLCTERPVPEHGGPRYPTLAEELALIEAGARATPEIPDDATDDLLARIWRRYGDTPVTEFIRASLDPRDPILEARIAGSRPVSAPAMKTHFTALAIAGRAGAHPSGSVIPEAPRPGTAEVGVTGKGDETPSKGGAMAVRGSRPVVEATIVWIEGADRGWRGTVVSGLPDGVTVYEGPCSSRLECLARIDAEVERVSGRERRITVLQ